MKGEGIIQGYDSWGVTLGRACHCGLIKPGVYIVSMQSLLQGSFPSRGVSDIQATLVSNTIISI